MKLLPKFRTWSIWLSLWAHKKKEPMVGGSWSPKNGTTVNIRTATKSTRTPRADRGIMTLFTWRGNHLPAHIVGRHSLLKFIRLSTNTSTQERDRTFARSQPTAIGPSGRGPATSDTWKPSTQNFWAKNQGANFKIKIIKIVLPSLI